MVHGPPLSVSESPSNKQIKSSDPWKDWSKLKKQDDDAGGDDKGTAAFLEKPDSVIEIVFEVSPGSYCYHAISTRDTPNGKL